MIFSFEKGIIKNYGRFEQIDAIWFSDDRGTQNSLMISPQLWRDVCKNRYKDQFDLAHSLGKQVYFHSCGYIYDIIPLEKLGKEFVGKVCFNCLVDHKTVATKGSRDEIFDYVKKLNDHLGYFNGEYIGYIEVYHSIGMSEDNYSYIVEAFEKL
ncbi:MAG: hypothetical protein GX974_03610 [Clostridiales bacterium]|mgnify:CR=1 FL=1|nr:hypothetical protein [Clostridiales bacterium]